MHRNSQLFVIISLALSACFSKPDIQETEISETTFTEFEVKYAKGFSVHIEGPKKLVYIHEPSSGNIIDTLDISSSTPQNSSFFSRIVAQSTTHFAFMRAIGGLKSLHGLCGIQYLTQEQQESLFKTHEICNAQGMDLEKIVAINPDLVFLYPFGDQDKIRLKRLGIRNVYLTEYLENSALARAEWLKFFALITGGNPQDTQFDEIERRYLELLSLSETSQSNISGEQESRNKVVFNLPFGDSWDMPSGNSISAKLVQDAGFDYKFIHNTSVGNLTFKLEEAYQHLLETDYWIIIAARPKDFNLNDLISENKIYGQIPAVINSKVCFCNTEVTPYFSDGPIEPHILLQDLIACKSGKDSGNKYFKVLR